MCVSVCVHRYTCAIMYVHRYIVCVCQCAYTGIHGCQCVYASVHVSVCVHRYIVCVCQCVYTDKHVCQCVHQYTCVHVCTQVPMCVFSQQQSDQASAEERCQVVDLVQKPVHCPSPGCLQGKIRPSPDWRLQTLAISPVITRLKVTNTSHLPCDHQTEGHKH